MYLGWPITLVQKRSVATPFLFLVVFPSRSGKPLWHMVIQIATLHGLFFISLWWGLNVHCNILAKKQMILFKSWILVIIIWNSSKWDQFGVLKDLARWAWVYFWTFHNLTGNKVYEIFSLVWLMNSWLLIIVNRFFFYEIQANSMLL